MSLNMDDYGTAQFVDENGAQITNMNADWTTKVYPMAKLEHLMVSIDWDAGGVTGDLYLDYISGDSSQVKSQVNLTGVSTSEAWLDANVGAKGIRIRFVHTGGAANISSVGITLKGSK